MTTLTINRNAIDSIMRRAIDALCASVVEYDADCIFDLIDQFDDLDDTNIDDATYAIIDIIDSTLALLDINIDSIRPLIDASCDAR